MYVCIVQIQLHYPMLKHKPSKEMARLKIYIFEKINKSAHYYTISYHNIRSSCAHDSNFYKKKTMKTIVILSLILQVGYILEFSVNR